jgi:hypothetical protein
MINKSKNKLDNYFSSVTDEEINRTEIISLVKKTILKIVNEIRNENLDVTLLK